MDRFIKLNKNRSFEERTYKTKDCIDFFIDGCNALLVEENMPAEKIKLLRIRKDYLEKMLSK